MASAADGRRGIPFPARQPPGYEWLDDEPRFDPDRHLRLEPPSTVRTLRDLGYDARDIEPTATPVAVSEPFRILSDEGVEVLLASCRRLRRFSRPAGNRIEQTVRGGCYRSRFLRDLCTSAEVTAVMSEIYGVGVAPHTMPVHLGHLNYEPRVAGAAVDKWHHDTIPLDYVLMVSDPTTLAGGRFEYFQGTKQEAAELTELGRRPPAERVVAPEFPGPGYAIALHGDMVVHRAAPLAEPGERITMVNAYVALDRTRADQSRARDLIGVDDPSHLYVEWARHVAWRAEGRLAALRGALEYGLDGDRAATLLEAAVDDVRRAIDDMRAGPREAEHYEGPSRPVPNDGPSAPNDSSSS